jgi:hypothetical protein
MPDHDPTRADGAAELNPKEGGREGCAGRSLARCRAVELCACARA